MGTVVSFLGDGDKAAGALKLTTEYHLEPRFRIY